MAKMNAQMLAEHNAFVTGQRVIIRAGMDAIREYEFTDREYWVRAFTLLENLRLQIEREIA